METIIVTQMKKMKHTVMKLLFIKQKNERKMRKVTFKQTEKFKRCKKNWKKFQINTILT